jgi:hypothetical protein
MLNAKVVTQGSTRQQEKIVALNVQEESIKKMPQYYGIALYAQLDTASTQQITPEIATNAPLDISEVFLRGMKMTMFQEELELFNQNLEWPYAKDVFLVFSKCYHIKLDAQFVQKKRLLLKWLGPQNVSIVQLEKMQAIKRVLVVMKVNLIA